MARQTWDGEDEGDGEDFDEEDSFVRDDDEPTVACPYCGEEIHEDSPRCPHCENYLSQEDAPATATNKPWWFLLGAGLGLLVFLRWLFV
jgi:predicted nucleic acid-binding Zn ribbon protein